MLAATAMSDRSATAVLFVCSLLVYVYFFQGYGFNQNAHFATLRALVERRTWEITSYVADPYADGFTGDVSFVGGRTYSSKPPGLALLAAPVYAAAYHVERAAGRDPTSPAVARFNLYLLTIWAAGVPAAILV